MNFHGLQFSELKDVHKSPRAIGALDREIGSCLVDTTLFMSWRDQQAGKLVASLKASSAYARLEIHHNYAR